MKEKKLEIYLFFILLAIALYLTFSILAPYLQVLSLALVFAVIFEPLYKKIQKIMGGWNSVAAMITVTLIIIVVLIPIILYGMALSGEIRNLYTSFFTSNNSTDLISTFTTNANIFIQKHSPFAYQAPVFDVSQTQEYIFSVFAWVRGHFGDIFSGLTTFFIDLLLLIVSFYFLLRDGEILKKFVVNISPFNDQRDEEILGRLKKAIMSVVKGSLLIALVQGFLTGLGFYMFGIPSALLWGGVAAIASLVPSVGTSLVIVPGIIYLFATGQTAGWIGLLIWSIMSVSFIDNILASYLVGRGARVHPLLVLLSALGGISYFGPLGFIFGPVIVSFLFALFDIYKTILIKDAVSK
ncbi:MAG: AI-2E family transporter [Candidatus Paceibacterota bacterium]